MSRTMIQAAVTMNQLQSKMDTVGHNIANSQTPGYKTRRSEFSSLLKQQFNNLNAPENAMNRLTPEGIRIGSGARLGTIGNDYSLGALQTTNRALDLALRNENHFFQIQTEEDGTLGTRYSRDGSFYLRPSGDGANLVLTNSDGDPLLGQAGAPVVIADGFEEISVSDNGEVLVERDGQTEVVGSIGVVNFTRPEVLQETGRNLFQLPDVAELGLEQAEVMQPVGAANGLMESGVLEQSNVDLAEQMTDLITAQRAYQFNARTISTTDQMMGLVNQLRT